MRMIKITTKHNGVKLINPDHITCITRKDNSVFINLSCGNFVLTKFTDIDYALDYVQRAPSHSLVGG